MAKTGKWAFLLDVKNEDGTARYPELGEDPTYDEVMERHRQEYRSLSLEQLAVKLNEYEAEKDTLNQELSRVDSHITALERLMVTQFETNDIEKVRVGGFTFSSQVEPVVTKSDPAALVAWYTKYMPERLTINHQSLLGDVRQALTGEGELPEGVTVNTFRKISRRK